jgi:hypothetical protein
VQLERAKPEGLAYLEAKAKAGILWEKGVEVVVVRASSGSFDSAAHDKAVSGLAQDDSRNKQRQEQ